MLLKLKIDKLEPTSKKYLFIELHPEDWKSKYKHKSIASRVMRLAKELNGAMRGSVVRIERNNLHDNHMRKLLYLDKLSTRYKQLLLRNKFNYKFRQGNSEYLNKRNKRFVSL